MGWDGVYYGLPMFLVACLVAWGILIAGGVPVVWGWGRIAVQKHNTGNRIVPKALCVVTASLGVNPAGFIIFLLIPFELKERFAAFLVCCAAMVFGSLVSLTGPLIWRDRNVARDPALISSVAIAAVNVLGLVWLFNVKNTHSLQVGEQPAARGRITADPIRGFR